MKPTKRKVLLIGWDAADWKFLSPLLDQGLMPNLQGLIEGGVKGRLATLDPPLSPTLWTSIATGKRPYKHGIHGFTEPEPDGKGVRPMYITNRKVKAIWNILTQQQLKTHVVGWWPSHPAEPINGIMVSNFIQRVTAPYGTHWPLAKGCVHPATLADTFAELRVHPKELTGAHIQPFVPDAWKVNQAEDDRLRKVAKITADCATIHNASTYILDTYEWDFMAVYLDGIDHYCHEFMKYHPPRRPQIDTHDFEIYQHVLKGACLYHDMMLGRLLELAGEDTTVVLISDHGFYPDHNRPNYIPREPIGPTIEHSPYGIIVMKGPGIKSDELVFGASLLDITPTLLTLYGLPVGEDMDGKVLTAVFETPPEIKKINSWEHIEGADGTHPKDLQPAAEDNRAELQQLVALGYIEDPGDNQELAAQRATEENNYHLARAYLDGGEWEEGIALLEKLHAANPYTLRYATRLAYTYMQVGKYRDARRIVDHVRESFDRESPYLDLLEGTLLLSEQRYRKALDLFLQVEKEAGELPKLNLHLANAYLQLNRLEEAARLIRKEIKIEPEDAAAWHSLGVVNYKLMQYQEAVDAFMQAIGLHYYYPAAHFYLGETLMAMERYEDAAHAFDVCLRLMPGFNIARARLITIYEQFLEQPSRAFRYRTDFENNLQGEITIVSGLPRSGTSMMMQMLQAGGKTIFSDGERQADENNPRGYFEHEAVKQMPKNKSWLPDANGKVVKVIAQLLHHLPRTYRYRVIFMDRDIYEVVQSQQRMLKRNGKKVAEDQLPINLVNAYRQSLEHVKKWAAEEPNVEVLYLNHSDILEDPFQSALLINDFLDGGLQVEAMAGVVDNSLHREKI